MIIKTLKNIVRNARTPVSGLTLVALVGCNIAGGPQDMDDTGWDTGSGTVIDDGTDADGDGWTVEDGDCNDDNAAINPGAQEILDNAVDENCDGVIAQSDPDDEDEYIDLDGDGYAGNMVGGDCDDYDPAINPAAAEIVHNWVDENCDGVINNDADGDGHDSDEWGGYDCDDSDATINPSRTETIDGRDEDCSGNGAEVVMTLGGGDGVTWWVDGESWTLTEGVSSTTSEFTMSSGDTISFCWTSSTDNVGSWQIDAILYADMMSAWVDGNRAYCNGVVAN